ncbi:hypothetical protein BBJ28_00006668 [Nothophytophthora sp. Chile5]|nr:hypothetical protein BBJ28_00006668 [Nothophytophthora sp. Chile5]
MASFLMAFNARLATYMQELKRLQEKNNTERAFQPTFWLQHPDFALARDATGSIGHTVTKFSLVYSKTPSKEEGASICEAIEKPCEQLLDATKVALFCGAGPSLATEILNDALSGSCAAVHWPRCVTMLNSTVEELKEFLAEQDEEGDDDGQAAALDEVELDDDFAFDSSLSAEERVLFESGLKLLSMCAAIMKRGVLTVKKLTITNDQAAFLEWTAQLDVSYTAAQDAIVDFGAALYPPVGVEELSEAVKALEASASTILACLSVQPELSAADEDALLLGQAAFDKQQLQAAMAADLVSGFSIWAVPEDPAVQELSEVVEEYAARLETPAFLPHMTVLSGVKNADGYEVCGGELADLTECHSSVLRLRVDPSFIYGDLATPAKAELAKELRPRLDGKRLKVRTAAQQLAGRLASLAWLPTRRIGQQADELALCPRQLGKLQLWRTLGSVETWEMVAELPLQ